MDLPINCNPPLVMHIDLNSCFATVEQQANPLLRGKPVGVAAYDSPGGCIISPSIEAKQYGVKVGMRVKEGRLLCPDLIVRTPDPPKYRDVHLKFKQIFRCYSSQVYPKSIDEAVIDFEGMENWLGRRIQNSEFRIQNPVTRRGKEKKSDFICHPEYLKNYLNNFNNDFSTREPACRQGRDPVVVEAKADSLCHSREGGNLDWIPHPQKHSLRGRQVRDDTADGEGKYNALIAALVDIGLEIKRRMKDEIGEWIRCNIGLGTNRFLAKLASGLHKPDGLSVITSKNLQQVYESVELMDLCGINTRMQARLNMAGIFTPRQFWEAEEWLLRKQVFKSVLGYYWYLRLRGWEVDAVEFGRRSFGQSYALKQPTDDKKGLSRLLMKLVEKMGRRLRRQRMAAQGIHVACIYTDATHWHKSRKFFDKLYATTDLFRYAQLVFNCQPQLKKVGKLAVSCYDLVEDNASQLGLFDKFSNKEGENLSFYSRGGQVPVEEGESESAKRKGQDLRRFGFGDDIPYWFDKKKAVSEALDRINDRYGEYVITPALMMGLDDQVIDRIAYGGTGELEELYR